VNTAIQAGKERRAKKAETSEVSKKTEVKK
jgi:hypothetical protein